MGSCYWQEEKSMIHNKITTAVFRGGIFNLEKAVHYRKDAKFAKNSDG